MSNQRWNLEDDSPLTGQKLVGYVVLIFILAAFCFVLTLVYFKASAFADERTVNPCSGHGVECCEQLRKAEDYSPSCETWAERFFPVFPLCCSEPEPTPTQTPVLCEVDPMTWQCRPSPTVTPSPSCETEPWLCPCASPTPLPTPVSHAKGQCCREVQAIYHDEWLNIMDRKNVALKALRRWKAEQMAICRQGYQHPVEPAPW